MIYSVVRITISCFDIFSGSAVAKGADATTCELNGLFPAPETGDPFVVIG